MIIMGQIPLRSVNGKDVLLTCIRGFLLRSWISRKGTTRPVS